MLAVRIESDGNSSATLKVTGRGVGTVCPVLHSALELLSTTCSQLQTTTFNIMFHPIAQQLENLPGK
jgi:hypothetical protein